MNATGNFTSGPVCIDDVVTVLAQYPTDVRWNGWLLPRMDAHAVVTVLEAIAHDGYTEQPPTYDWEDDVLVVTERDGEEVYLDRLEPDADGLYALGAYAWVWAEDTDTEGDVR